MKTLALALVVLGSACATDDEQPIDQNAPKQLLPTSQHPTYSLWVSNQSFDQSLVDIKISIDGRPAVAGKFPVNTQHTWYRFDFALPAGPHQIKAVTADWASAVLDTTTAQKFGVVNFWYDAATDQPAEFIFTGSDSPPGFD